MALACRYPLVQFMEKIAPYEASLGSFTQRSMKAVGKKAKWALVVEEEVDKLRTVVSAKVISINMLLSLHASEALSRLEGSSKTRHGELLSKVESQRRTMQQAAADASYLRKELPEYHRTVQQGSNVLKTEMNSRFDTLDAQAVDLASEVSTLTIGIASNTQALINLRDLGSQIMKFIRTFPVELRGLLQQVIQVNLRNYHVLLAIQNSISTPPSLLCNSNIRFEDALGVVRMLPFEWFRYWEVCLDR